MHFLEQNHIELFLIQVFLLLGISRSLGELFRHYKQPAVSAEILTGILLGPTVFGRIFPAGYMVIFPHDPIQIDMLETVAWVGILFFLLETGMEIDFASAWRQRGDALVIALSDLFIPLIISFFAIIFFIPEFSPYSVNVKVILFLSTAMAVSAMPLTALILQEYDMYKTEVGFLIMSALSVNEMIGWVIFSIVLGTLNESSPSFIQIVELLLAVVSFLVLSLTAGRSVINRLILFTKKRRYPEPGTSLTIITLLGMISGALMMIFGIHALFGFFLAGVIAGSARSLPERTRHVISQMVHAIFIPLFFSNLGLQIDFLHNFNPSVVLIIVIAGIVARFIGAYAGAFFSKQPRFNYLLISTAHIPAGEIQLVVGILALEYHFISEQIFVALVLSAVFSGFILGPLMKFALGRYKEFSMVDFFSRRAIIPSLQSPDRYGIIRELCNAICEQENLLDCLSILEGVLLREKTMGTAIGEGVAIPHSRFSILSRPLIAFGRSEQGVDWDSPDGNPVHLVFLILSPSDDNGAQLQILRHIAREMISDQTRTLLFHSHDPDELWGKLHTVFTPKSVIGKGAHG